MLASPRRIFVVNIAVLAFLATPLTAESYPSSKSAPTTIVIGFVGGFVRRNNPHQQPVKLARELRRTLPPDSYVRIFENRHRSHAYRTILHLLDVNHDGRLSTAEKNRARIILFGHSWGAAAAVLLARDLDRQYIPVLLTVQVDSVAKFWQNDSVIPDNVAEAVNFYQPHGLVHGEQHIRAADPSKTEILGNVRIDYREHPVECSGISWFDRYITPSHAESECDPQLWSQVKHLVEQVVSPQEIEAENEPAQR